MTQYIPYSIRNNITDPDLAGLLDYLEREMGWTMELCESDEWITHFSIADSPCDYGIDFPMDIEDENFVHIWIQPWENGGPNMQTVATIHKDIFLRTYKSILPVIRDLYSKK